MSCIEVLKPEDGISHIISKAEALPWQERLAWIAARPGLKRFSTSLSLEDQVITHSIAGQGLGIEIFTLDTGRLFEETYTLLQQTVDSYGVPIRAYYPDPLALETFVNEQGINGFYNSVENRKACCFIRKVEPLARALDGVDIWISGLRREHSDHRQDLPVAEWDAANNLIKFYPLIDVSEEAVKSYIATHNIPYNPLHDQGFPSIGCAPCTRAIGVGEHPRAGRWWWEQGEQECGLHVKDGKLVRKPARDDYAI